MGAIAFLEVVTERKRRGPCREANPQLVAVLAEICGPLPLLLFIARSDAVSKPNVWYITIKCDASGIMFNIAGVNYLFWVVNSLHEAIKSWTKHQHSTTWKIVQGCRHGKLFIDTPCKKRADGLLKLVRHELRIAVASLTGHAPVRGHLQTMGLFSGDPSCRFCRMETETVQHITCCCEALARQRYNIFGRAFIEPKEISTASRRDLCLFISDTGIMNLGWWKFRVAQ
jgi:hypothetical protein